MIKPHGGTLINRVVSGTRREEMIENAKEMPSFKLSSALRKDAQNIASGLYSPLDGFLCSDDMENVLEHSRLSSDVPWTIPILLDMSEEEAKEFSEGDEIILESEDGEPFCLMDVEEIYTYDKEQFSESVYGTKDLDHPGVQKTMEMGTHLVGGNIIQINEVPNPFEQYSLKPIETRVLFKEKGWRTVVGFQTRNVPHNGHEYIQKTALTFVDGIFINPIIGKKKSGDFTDEVILETYDVLMNNYYLKNRAVMSILEAEMRYAGPKEAIFHSIIRKNYGCTHFIVGRDHAGVGNYYGPYAAQDIFDEFPDIGITPIFFKSFTYCKKCGGAVDGFICPHGDEHRENFSGTKMRALLAKGKTPPPNMMRPEVAKTVIEADKKFVD